MQDIIDQIIVDLPDAWSVVKHRNAFTFTGYYGREIVVAKENSRIVATVKWPWQDGYRFTPWFCGIDGWNTDDEIQATCGISQPRDKIVRDLLSKVFHRLDSIYPMIESRFREHQRKRLQLEQRVKVIEAAIGDKPVLDGLEATFTIKFPSGVYGILVIDNHITLRHRIDFSHVESPQVDKILQTLAGSTSRRTE